MSPFRRVVTKIKNVAMYAYDAETDSTVVCWSDIGRAQISDQDLFGLTFTWQVAFTTYIQQSYLNRLD